MTPAPGKFTKTISADLSIIEFEAAHRKPFKELNVAWITKSFVMEESDETVLSDPEKHILEGGGAILLALYKNEIVGTCALTYEGHDTYELTKMAVDENLRGLKIGYHLGVATLEKAKLLGAKKVILHSNRKGSAAAINLYYKLGFKEIPLGNAPWARADIKMEIAVG
jgi:N-acetylglutamate synthase-like GNAT family acetyltransferase